MPKEELSTRQLSERDLLISLKTQMAEFKDYTREKFENFDRKIDESLKSQSIIRTDVDTLKVKVDENTQLRHWAIGAILTGIVSAVISFIGIVK